jgi:protein involved in polysaccharide export with SLBB domain
MFPHKSSTPRLIHALAFLFSLCTARLLFAQEGTDAAAKRAASSLVRPGDQIALRFLREPQMSATVGVNERGDAPFPKLGMLHVAELTISQVEDTLRSRYAEYLRAPELDIAVLRRVTVNGEVKVPNVYMVDINSTVRDAIAKAGGITENGSSGRVAIVRDGRRTSAKGWEREQGTRMDLQSGDQVLVGRKPWVVINFFSVVSTAVILITLYRTI